MLLLSACSQSAANPVAAAITCVEQQVPKGVKVTAESARATLATCRAEMEAWSRTTVERNFGKRLDRDDAKMLAAYRAHREVSYEQMLLEISDEIQPRFYRL